MTDFNAIAAVTTTIQYILQGTPTTEGISHDVTGASVTVEPPDVAGPTKSDILNVFLYHVSPNSGYRNEDNPARNSNGDLVTRPRLALNLYYLLTAYAADDTSLHAQQILASGMRILHEHPVLTRDVINSAVGGTAFAGGPGEGLADQIELVKLSLQPLTLEEITKLWTSFFQINYRISVAYEATVVLIDALQEPKAALPVTERLLTVVPFQKPMIEEVDPQILGYNSTAEITIKGLNLKSGGVFVLFGSTPATPQPANLSPTHITISVPPGLSTTTPTGLQVGIMPIQVVQPLQLGSPPVAHNGFESNVVALTLAPTIDPPAPLPLPQPWFAATRQGAKLNLAFEPGVSQEQDVALLIGDYTLPISQSNLGGVFPSSNLGVVLPKEVPKGNSLLLRLQVDGIESLPLVDADQTSPTYGQIIGPFIKVS